MNYMVKAPDGTESGPYSEQELIRHTSLGTITADYFIRPSIFPKWEKAERITFLKPMLHPGETLGDVPNVRTSFENRLEPCPAPFSLRALAAIWDLAVILLIFLVMAGAGTLFVRTEASADRTHKSVAAICKARDKAAEREKKKQEKSSQASEKQPKKQSGRAGSKSASAPDAETIPHPDPVKSVEKDYAPTIVADEEAGFHPGSRWTDTRTGETYFCISAASRNAAWISTRKLRPLILVFSACFFAVSLLYLVIPAGFTAQTRGMRFFGIFISDPDDPAAGEVLEIRASLCVLLSLFTCILAPVFLLFRKPTPAERLTHTRIIRVAAKSK